MARLDIGQANIDHSKITAKAIKASKDKAGQSVATSIWHWINGVASGVAHFGRVLGSAFSIVADYGKFLAGLIHFILTSLDRAYTWLIQFIITPLEKRLNREIYALKSRERRDVRYLIRLIYVAAQGVMRYAFNLTRREHRAMLKQIKHAEALAKLDVRRLHHRIEHEAASGYSLSRKDRTGLIVHLLEFAGVRNPVVRPVVADIASGLLDLLAVDDPIARITLGFLIKHVIDRLGIEKPLGNLISDLMSPILGDPNPKDLHDIMADISKRLDATETQWATFFGDGGSEVEQAGKDWQRITSITTSVAIVAFTVQAVVDPTRWASEIQTVIGGPANDMAARAIRLFGG